MKNNMKKSKLSLSLLVSLLCLAAPLPTAHAGSESGVGNGGGAVYCNYRKKEGTQWKNVRFYRFFDLFEGINQWKMPIPIRKTSVAEQIETALSKLDRIAPIAQRVRPLVTRIQKKLIFKKDEIQVIPDFTGMFAEKYCKYLQLATYRPQQVVQANKTVYDSLTATDHAALVLHEALYLFARKMNGARDSDAVRYVVAFLFSDRAWDPGVESYVNRTFEYVPVSDPQGGSPQGVRSCGTQGKLEDQIADCAAVFGDEATRIIPARDAEDNLDDRDDVRAFGYTWKLVSRMPGGEQIWMDMGTRTIWTGIFPVPLNNTDAWRLCMNDREVRAFKGGILDDRMVFSMPERNELALAISHGIDEIIPRFRTHGIWASPYAHHASEMWVYFPADRTWSAVPQYDWLGGVICRAAAR